MDLNWITKPLTMYGVLTSGGIAFLHLLISTKLEMRRQQKRHFAENGSLRETLAALQGKVAELCCEASERAAIPSSALTGFNIQKRAEALRMYRRGCGSHTIAEALGLTQAEVDLIGKVHLIATRPTEDGTAAILHQDSGKPFQSFSSKAMYSPDA
jgi:hypothetical protein